MPTVFIQFQQDIMDSMVIRGTYRLLLYGELLNLQYFMAVNTGPYGAGNFKMLLPLWFLSDLSQKFMDTLATMVE